MNVDFINPFLDAILNVLATMAQTEAKAEKPYVKESVQAMGDITGMIGLAGHQVRGSLAITFTESAILDIASKMLGETLTSLDGTVSDVVGEITNMVSGGAKKSLAEKGYKFEMAIPSTIAGKNHTITHKTRGSIIVVPFTTAAGSFCVEVCFEK